MQLQGSILSHTCYLKLVIQVKHKNLAKPKEIMLRQLSLVFS